MAKGAKSKTTVFYFGYQAIIDTYLAESSWTEDGITWNNKVKSKFKNISAA